MSLLNFDANEVEPSKGFEPIPAGKYVAGSHPCRVQQVSVLRL